MLGVFYRCIYCQTLLSSREPREFELKCPKCRGRIFFKPRPQRARVWRLVGRDWRRTTEEEGHEVTGRG